MENTTQETSAEAPKEDKVETQETKGVEQEVDTPSNKESSEGPTDVQEKSEESEDKSKDKSEDKTESEEKPKNAETEKEQEAEESLFKTLAKKKGLDPEDPKALDKVAQMAMDAESSLTRKSQEASDMEKLLGSLTEEEDKGTETEETEETEYTQSNRDPAISRLEAKDDMRTVADMHSDFYQYAEKMQEIAQDNHSSAFRGTKGVELLYKMAKAESMDEVTQQAKKEGRKEASEKEFSKLRSQVASGTKAKSQPKAGFSREDIAKRVAENDTEWLSKNLPEIEKQMKAGEIE